MLLRAVQEMLDLLRGDDWAEFLYGGDGGVGGERGEGWERGKGDVAWPGGGGAPAAEGAHGGGRASAAAPSGGGVRQRNQLQEDLLLLQYESLRGTCTNALVALAETAQLKPSTLEAQLQRARNRREIGCERSSVDYNSADYRGGGGGVGRRARHAARAHGGDGDGGRERVGCKRKSDATDEPVCCDKVTGDYTSWRTLEETVCACLLQVAPNGERPQPRLMQLALCAHNVHTKKKAVEVFLCKQFKRINSLN